MTGAPDALEPVPSAVAPSERDAWEGAVGHSPRWPVTRLAAMTLTLLLAVAIAGPIAVTQSHHASRFVLLLPAIVATLSARALFETLASGDPGRRLVRHIVSAALPTLLAVALISGAGWIIGLGIHPASIGITAALTLATLVGAGAARDLEIRVRLSLRRVYLIGSRQSQQDLARELSRRHDATLVGTATVDGPADRAKLAEAITNARPTVLVLGHDAMQNPDLVELARTLNLQGMHVRDLVSYYESEFKKVPLEELSPTWFLFDIAPLHQRRAYRALRRTLECLLSGALLVLALPVIAVAALPIKLTSPGPVLYRQQRVGKGGVPFTLIKLRTMRETGAGEAAWAGSEASRITPVGRVLRRFRLDELPQLWSVVRGDLALIGPRPEQVPIVAQLDAVLPHYSARHCIRPGITGWAQVNLGYAGSVEGTVAKLQRDLYYVKHSSLRLDALILWLTFKTVISGGG